MWLTDVRHTLLKEILFKMSLHHVFAGERLTAFSDAVFAIVATIMVGTESLL